MTADTRTSGSIAEFYYTIIGTKGKTAEYNAISDGNDRGQGAQDTYKFREGSDRDIGDFRCVSVRMEGEDAWLFTEV